MPESNTTDSTQKPSKINWSEVSDDNPDSDDLPEDVVTFNDEHTIKKVIHHCRNDNGDLVKETREYRLEHVELSQEAARRRTLKKFGESADDPPSGPNPANTQPSEEVFLKFVALSSSSQGTGQSGENAAGGEDDEESKKRLASRIGKGWCRFCNGSHQTYLCPFKEQQKALDEIRSRYEASAAAAAEGRDLESGSAAGGQADAAAAASAAAILAGGRSAGGGGRAGGGSGHYIPESLRRDLNKGGVMDRRDYTIRVSNLPNETKESDLHDLFKTLGKITRLYLAMDRTKTISRGFAYVTFATESDAQKAISGVNGYKYDHLILQVDWAKPN